MTPKDTVSHWGLQWMDQFNYFVLTKKMGKYKGIYKYISAEKIFGEKSE